MQTGIVAALNRLQARVVVSLLNGEYVVFDILSGVELAVGHQLRGKLGQLGQLEIYLVEQHRWITVWGESGPCSLALCLLIAGSESRDSAESEWNE